LNEDFFFFLAEEQTYFFEHFARGVLLNFVFLQNGANQTKLAFLLSLYWDITRLPIKAVKFLINFLPFIMNGTIDVEFYCGLWAWSVQN